MEIKEVKLKDLIQDDRNLNKGTEKGKELIEKSLRQFGAGRSVLIDKNNRIIAGNKTHENAVELGMDDVIVVETDGSKLVAVKRTDIDLDTKKGREMALADNATVKVDLEWDAEELNGVANDFGIEMDVWGVGMESDGEEIDVYSQKTDTPVYEAKEEKQPDLNELVDTSKSEELVGRIEEADIPMDIKEFLKLAAMRHVVFHYGRIAEYYCHASEDIQRLMEDSALVIIDLDSAIEKGYCKLKSELNDIMDDEG